MSEMLVDFLDIAKIVGLDTLPEEIRRNFALMKRIDGRCEEIKVKLAKDCGDFQTSAPSLTKVKKWEALAKINKQHADLRTNGEQKINLARQVYEMVDKHIRRLDEELRMFDVRDSREVQPEMIVEEKNEVKACSTNKKRGQKRNKTTNAPKDSTKKSRKNLKARLQQAAAEEASSSGGVAGSSGVGSGVVSLLGPFAGNGFPAPDVLDMPVDPNEPTYCFCRQVSYGEMIGCDNVDCPIEWFHFGCVNLSIKPRGEWYCRNCDKKKKK